MFSANITRIRKEESNYSLYLHFYVTRKIKGKLFIYSNVSQTGFGEGVSGVPRNENT
jgi:hypothetical protein